MRKIITILLVMLSIVGLSSCLGGVEFELNFVVDSETYDTVSTNGKEIVKMPSDPTKDGYTFDGWYWDKDEWSKPFTANSLLEAPLSSNMSVYAKWNCVHSASDWIIDTEATCKVAGSKHKECTECEAVLETVEIEKLTTHTPADAVKEDFVDSTCEAEGSYNSVVYCSVCEAKISSEAKVVEKKEHTPSDWIEDVAATCKAAGSKHKECTECEAVLETVEIEKLITHTPADAVKEDFVDSTCEAEGSYNSVVYCSVCEAKISSEAKVVEKKEHTPSEWIIDTEATCKAAGSKHKECTECEAVLETVEIEKLTTHTPADAVKEDFVDSTCEAEGSYNSVVYCSVCEAKILSEAKTVEKKEHTPSDWIEDVAAICKAAGSKHKECTECEAVLETVEIEKLTTHTPADAVRENFVDSDCKTEGSYNSVVYCSVCEAKISSEAKVVEKKEHTPSEWIIDTEATCKAAGSKHKECTECEEVVESESIPKTNDHTSVIDLMVMPTKTTTGLTEGAHCSECGEVIIKQVVISKLQSSTSEYRVDGNYIYFGEYPQTIKANNVIMTSAKDSRGYYLGSDGYYYAKVTANPYEDNYSFSNGESVENGEIYYFKVEPIKWKIVMLDNIYYTVVCDSIIANAMFSTSTNSYGSSYLKTFITNFINGKAFSDRQNSMIMEGPHPFTKDAVADFNDDEMIKITTDYARATGAFMSTEKENYGVGKWWLRTAGSNYNAYYVDAYGGVYSTHVQSKGVGVVISMVVELNPFFA